MDDLILHTRQTPAPRAPGAPNPFYDRFPTNGISQPPTGYPPAGVPFGAAPPVPSRPSSTYGQHPYTEMQQSSSSAGAPRYLPPYPQPGPARGEYDLPQMDRLSISAFPTLMSTASVPYDGQERVGVESMPASAPSRLYPAYLPPVAPEALHTAPSYSSLQSNATFQTPFAPALPAIQARPLPIPFSRMPASSPSGHRLSIHSTFSSSSSASGPPITAPLPTIHKLQLSRHEMDRWPDAEKLSWAEDCVRLVDINLYPGGSPADFPSTATAAPQVQLPTELDELLGVAVPIIISYTTHPTSGLAATALFLRAKLLSTGAYPDLLPRDQRQAFRDFEHAAKGGENRAWFRLGRDYEGVGDLGRARECFEKGSSRGDCESTYRMGMAHLLGQLHLSPDPPTALPLLQQANNLCTIDFPQPSYVYGMLLAGELSTPTPISPSLLLPPTSHQSDALSAQHQSARESIERAAYLGLAPAQLKSGYFFEHAALGSVYDPLMSVQWYSLASQGGEVEADMALSKWFLCGAEGHFAKNEELARTFAEKAARKGHPNGCFAMGYYYEIGIGGRQDRDQAIKWYQRAAKLDNADAKQRLAALTSSSAQTLSLSEHQSKLNETLVRRHTQAKIRSDRTSIRRPPRGTSKGARVDAAKIDAAARAAAAAPPTPMLNPNGSAPGSGSGNGVQPGQLFSPNPAYAATPTPTPQAYPRPQQQQQTNPASPHRSNGGGGGRPARPQVSIPNSNSLSSVNQMSSSSPVNGRPSAPSPSGPNMPRGYALRDSAVHNLPTSSSVQSVQLVDGSTGKAKGPQTFAEMGFVSKPVEEDGCVIM